jgi:hypothetical protein
MSPIAASTTGSHHETGAWIFLEKGWQPAKGLDSELESYSEPIL